MINLNYLGYSLAKAHEYLIEAKNDKRLRYPKIVTDVYRFDATDLYSSDETIRMRTAEKKDELVTALSASKEIVDYERKLLISALSPNVEALNEMLEYWPYCDINVYLESPETFNLRGRLRLALDKVDYSTVESAVEKANRLKFSLKYGSPNNRLIYTKSFGNPESPEHYSLPRGMVSRKYEKDIFDFEKDITPHELYVLRELSEEVLPLGESIKVTLTKSQ